MKNIKKYESFNQIDYSQYKEFDDFLTFEELENTTEEERKTIIVKSVQDSKNRLNEAQKRLTEAEKQLKQASFVINEIKNETILTKKKLLESDSYEAKKDLKISFDRAVASFQSKERQIFLEIKQQIISLILQRTVIRIQETYGSKERATSLINDTINKLEGDLL